MDRLADRLDMTIVVNWDVKTQTKQTNKTRNSDMVINKKIKGNREREPGAVARSEACPLGMQAALSLIPKSGTFFRGDLVMKNVLRPFSLFR